MDSVELPGWVGGKSCPKCGRSSWGITWHPADRDLCLDQRPSIEEAHLHWTCPCGYRVITKTKEDSKQ